MHPALRCRSTLLALLVCAACTGNPGDGELRGEALGLFDVLATQRSNDCGSGALGESDELSFEVELSRLPSEVFWDDRRATVVGNNQFELTDQVVAEVRAAAPGTEAGCSVVRSDHISVHLEESEPGAIDGFRGEMSYAFRVATESSCLPTDVRLAGVARLPCAISYALAGRQRQDPNQDF